VTPRSLRPVVEDGLTALQLQVTPAKCGEAECLVVSRIALASDAKEPEVEEPDTAGQDAIAHQAGTA
jgi:hypothetical protein